MEDRHAPFFTISHLRFTLHMSLELKAGQSLLYYCRDYWRGIIGDVTVLRTFCINQRQRKLCNDEKKMKGSWEGRDEKGLHETGLKNLRS